MQPIKFLLSWPVLIIGLIALMGISALAVEPGEDYQIASVDCYNGLDLRIRGQNNLTDGEYKILGCHWLNASSNKEEYWECWCTNNTANIYLGTSENTSNIYDVFVQYYIGDEKNYSNERIEEFNNIVVEKGGKKKEPFVMPKLEGGVSIIMVIVIIFMSIIFLGLILIKKLSGGEENEIGGMDEKPLEINKEEPKKEEKQEEDEETIDLDDFLKKRNI